ncbi:MAG: alpha/beta hydrolase [Pseudomonadota bacterium]
MIEDLEYENMTAPKGARIAYLRKGSGHPVILVHGFASNARVNWLGTGWIDFLAEAGFQVVALDNRGHGQSEKFYQDDDYKLSTMAYDVMGLIEGLGFSKVHIMGYSMGARISSIVTSNHPERIGKLIIAGNGYNMIEGGFDSSAVSNALLADQDAEVSTPIGQEFRAFAKQTKSDLKALAACVVGAREHIMQSVFESIQNETLVTIGTNDTVAHNGEHLAQIMPHAVFRSIPNRNHMNAVGDKVYKQNVVDFLQAG